MRFAVRVSAIPECLIRAHRILRYYGLDSDTPHRSHGSVVSVGLGRSRLRASSS